MISDKSVDDTNEAVKSGSNGVSLESTVENKESDSQKSEKENLAPKKDPSKVMFEIQTESCDRDSHLESGYFSHLHYSKKDFSLQTTSTARKLRKNTVDIDISTGSQKSEGTPRRRLEAIVSSPISPAFLSLRKPNNRFSGKEQESTESSIRNPFETFLLDSLHTSTFSPSVFAKIASPDENEESGSHCGQAASGSGEFRWSIDQLAIINPAAIDEMPEVQLSADYTVDPLLEASLQDAINNFWNSHLAVVPSPPEAGNSGLRLRVRAHVDDVSTPPSTQQDNVNESEGGNLMPVGHSKTQATQTSLTLPPDFDLQRLIGVCFYTDKEVPDKDESFSAANLSICSLRRKLFENDDDDNGEYDEFLDRSFAEEQAQNDLAPGGSSWTAQQHDMTPISRNRRNPASTTLTRRASLLTNDMPPSPQMSPI